MRKAKRYVSLFAALFFLLPCSALSANALEPPYISWEERIVPNQFTETLHDDTEYHSPGASNNPYVIPPKIDESEIGGLLCQATATGYDDYGTAHTIDCRVFSLNSISAAYAVAVEYEGYEGYFPFVNESYMPETLGVMIDDLGLHKNLVRNRITYYRWPNYLNGDGPSSITYKMPDDSALWGLLLSNVSATGAKNEGDFPRMVDHEFMVASVFLDVIGGGVRELHIYPGGTLFVSLPKHNTIRFSVGETTVKSFMEHVRTHGDTDETEPGLDHPTHGDNEESEPNPGKHELWIKIGVASVASVAALVAVISSAKKKRSKADR